MGHGPLTAGFTGRSRELAVLAAMLGAARSGTGGVVVVSGEAGIGKTTFCREVMVTARRDGFRTAWGSCWPTGGAPPLWPWGQVLDLLSEGRGGQVLREDPGGLSVDPERFARFSAVVSELATRCRRQPALIVIDDAHAADPGALLLARFISRHLTSLPLVLLLSVRGDLADATRTIDLGHEATTLELGRFGREETADLLRTRGLPTADPDVLAVLVGLTGGHPLHLQQILATDGGIADPNRPHGVEVAIRQAIDRLTPATRTCLSRGAVLGPELWPNEAARVAEVSPSALADAAEEAVGAGLIERPYDDDGCFSYRHELIREIFLEGLSRSERVRCHAGAAELLAPEAQAPADRSGRTSLTRQSRYAYHRVRAASRSAADARAAVTACRTTAAAMAAGYAYEQAVSLLEDAVAVRQRAGLADPAAELMVERAEAVLRCGRLTETRGYFDEAVAAAVAEHDAVSLARAALGLGGVWVNEHRTVIEWDRVTGLQRRALAGLPADQQVLRQRLTMRLAAEHLYRGGPVEPVLAGLEAARRLGHGMALAEALSLAHHGLLTAGRATERLALAEELIAVAAPAGEGLLALIGLCWRTVDLFHLGDPGAARSWDELHERADALGCLSVLHAAEAMGVMMSIRAGRLEEAEAQAHACWALGTKVGDPDAAAYLGAQLSTIRWCQGRETQMAAELLELADSSSLNPAEFGFHATAAHLTARAGHHQQARAMLVALTGPGLATLPDSSTWLAGMLEIVETARLLGEVDVLAEAYELLLPLAELPIMPSLAVTCLGSVQRPLGLAALALGHRQAGIDHLRAAVTANRSFRNRPLTAISMAELAAAYLEGPDPGSTQRRQAVELLTAACDEATAIGMSGYLEVWRSRLADIREDAGLIEHRDGHWHFGLGARRAEVADRVGVRYLAQLLTNPGRSISAAELAAGVGGAAVESRTVQVVLDDRAKAGYRRRLAELAAGIEDADDTGDADRSEALSAERQALVAELHRVTGLGGRTRGFADPGERARTAVRKALMRAVDELAAADPVIGQHVRIGLSTGSTCCYTPDRAHPVQWRSSTANR